MNYRMFEVFRAIINIFLIIIIILSLDDIIYDIYANIKRKSKLKSKLIKIKDLDSIPPTLIAIFVPAWREEKVISDMLQNNLSMINYSKSFYHIFVGVYPNDLETQAAIRPLLSIYKNLHMVINYINGPTTKANNINNIYANLKIHEEITGISFDIVIIHDSEDIIHPTSLKLVNFLIQSKKYSAVQLPVFPLQPYPTLKKFFINLTSGTYADEFAENHFRTMVARENANLIVPSAGTGFAISRTALYKIEENRSDHLILNQNSLTEDYELSLYMQKMGIDVHYFLQGLERVLSNSKIVKEYIATREFFPNTLHEAVKQKARWIYGIAFQSAKYIKLKDYSPSQKYSIIHDWKAKYANIIIAPCYFIIFYVILAYIISLPTLVSYKSLGWYLSLVLTIMAFERQIMRAMALKNVYGWRSAILSNFLLPILPIRFTWGNIINFLATLSAWRIHLFGSSKTKSKWAKTEHSYLPKDMLENYRVKLGDLILQKELIDPLKLQSILNSMNDDSKQLGEILIEDKIISEKDLLSVLAELLGTGYLENIDKLIDPVLGNIFSKDLAFKFNVIPLLMWRDKILLASSQIIGDDVQYEIEQNIGIKPLVILVPSAAIKEALQSLYLTDLDISKLLNTKRIGELLIENNLVDLDQLLQAFKIQKNTGEKLGEILVKLNVITNNQLQEIITSYNLNNYTEGASIVSDSSSSVEQAEM
ncbi:phage adsorption protein NrfB [Clostridium frigoris]|uniref:Phage adsorption protein NrfB n=1 Tax=Clostridium frigoris TaxID=205327 RepID=A0ABS6BWD1_9CLOT|nr:phage adsorption protein NrfB [Clostridium frigoris]